MKAEGGSTADCRMGPWRVRAISVKGPWPSGQKGSAAIGEEGSMANCRTGSAGAVDLKKGLVYWGILSESGRQNNLPYDKLGLERVQQNELGYSELRSADE